MARRGARAVGELNAVVRRRLMSALRVGVCIAALIFVLRGVSLDDTVTTRDGVAHRGQVVRSSDDVVLRTGDASEIVIRSADLARDDAGEPQIDYGLRTTWRRSDKAMLFIALLVQIPVAVLLGVRLQMLLRNQQIHVGWWNCVRLSYAGNFLNFAAPLGSNAGDLFKAYFISLHTDRRAQAMTTILLDRLLGLGTLVAVVAAITVCSPADNRLARFRGSVLVVLAIGVIGAALYQSRRVRNLLPGGERLRSLPGFHHAQAVDEAVLALLRSRLTMARAILVTLAVQAAAIGSYVFVIKALGFDVRPGNVLEFFTYFYIGAVVQSLPGPPQGLGTVELAYRFLFAEYAGASEIVCMSFLIRVVVLLSALPGAWVTMTGSYKPRETAAGSKPTETPPASA